MFLHRISRYDSQEIPGTNNKSHFLQITSILYSCYFEMSIKSIIARLQFYLNDTFVYVVRQKRAIAWSSSNPYRIIKISTHNVYRIFPDSTPVSCRSCPSSKSAPHSSRFSPSGYNPWIKPPQLSAAESFPAHYPLFRKMLQVRFSATFYHSYSCIFCRCRRGRERFLQVSR